MTGVELGGVAMFAGLDAAELQALNAAAFTRRLTGGQVLFVAGEPSEHLFVVRSGRLRIQTSSARGEQLQLTTVGPGEALGELSILDREPRSADAIAVEPTELIALPARVVRELLERDNRALLAVSVELARNVRRITGAMADLLFLDLPRRLSKLLLAQSVVGADGTRVADLAASQSAVAAQLGVTRQSLNKALTGLGRRGWISVDGRRVVLHDPQALERFVES